MLPHQCGYRYFSERLGDCHTSDIGHWFAMTCVIQWRAEKPPFGKCRKGGGFYQAASQPFSQSGEVDSVGASVGASVVSVVASVVSSVVSSGGMSTIWAIWRLRAA